MGKTSNVMNSHLWNLIFDIYKKKTQIEVNLGCIILYNRQFSKSDIVWNEDINIFSKIF